MDWKFKPTPSIDWQQINVELHMIPGEYFKILAYFIGSKA